MASKKVVKPSVADLNAKKSITVEFWVYINNNGDGGASALAFDSEAAAEEYASHDDERYTDDIYKKTLEFSLDGKLVTPNPVR